MPTASSPAEIIERHRAMLRSRKIEKKEVDLQTVVSDTLALVAYDIQERQIEVVRRPAREFLPPPWRSGAAGAGAREPGDQCNGCDGGHSARPAPHHDQQRGQAHRYRLVVVHDTGPGLPADLQGRLFTPFVTTKSHGVGIGLAIARTIVEAHGGTIGARNSPVGGAIFTITLPASDAHEIQPVLPAIVDIVGEPPNT